MTTVGELAASSAARRGNSSRSARSCSGCGGHAGMQGRVIRKWERRAALLEEMRRQGAVRVRRPAGGRDAARQGHGPPARLGQPGATPAVLQATAPRSSRPSGPDRSSSRCRGDAFTRSLVGLIGGGVKVLDVAGNDEIALTAIVRPAAGSAVAEEAPPAGRVLASDALLTEPAARRLTLRRRWRGSPRWRRGCSGGAAAGAAVRLPSAAAA